MNKKLILLVSCFLGACGGGSGRNGPNLTPAEHLFGAGIGTGATPSHLIPREGGNGYEILSFGAWGNVYELKKTSDTISPKANMVSINAYHNAELYDFTGQQKLQMQDWHYEKDASVSNAIFTGPAIMYSGKGWLGDMAAEASDYGTVKIQFGYDIADPARVEFVMSNPENSINMTSGYTMNFSEDRNNVYIWAGYKEDPGKYESPSKFYQGYGHKN